MKNKEIKLVNELFELWESFAQAGELSIGYGFNENYKRLKEQVLILNKVSRSLPTSKEVDSYLIDYTNKNTMKDLGIRKENDNLRINELRLKKQIEILELANKRLIEQLKLNGVGVSLPSKEERDIKIKYFTDVIFGEVKECEKRNHFIVGFRACYRWLKIEIK